MTEIAFFKLRTGLSRAVTASNKKAVYRFTADKPTTITIKDDIRKFRGRPADYIECNSKGEALDTEMSRRLGGKPPVGASPLSKRVYNKSVREELEGKKKSESEDKEESAIKNKLRVNSLDNADFTTIYSSAGEENLVVKESKEEEPKKEEPKKSAAKKTTNKKTTKATESKKTKTSK